MKSKVNLFIILSEIAMLGMVATIFYRASMLHESMVTEALDAKKMLIAADELRHTSDDLTHFARTYAVTQNPEFKERYFATLDIRNGKAPRPAGYSEIYWDLPKEVRERKHPAGANKSLDALIGALPFTPGELAKLQEAEKNSNDLVDLEVEAFNALEGRFRDAEGHYTVEGEPDPQHAVALLHSKAYYDAKRQIMDPIDDFLSMLNHRIDATFAQLHRKIEYNERLLFSVILGFIFVNLLIYRYLDQRNIMTLKELEQLVEQRTEKLAESEEKLQEAQRLAHIGSWELDLTTHRMTYSKEAYRIFEVTPEAFDASFKALVNFIHPDDRGAVETTYNDSVAHHTPCKLEHRLLLQNGSVKHVLVRGETFYDEQGTPVRSIGTMSDITDQKLYEQRLAEREALLSALVEQSIEGIALSDMEGRFIMVNTACSELLGYSKEELLRMSIPDLLAPGVQPELLSRIKRTEQPGRREAQLRRKDGTLFMAEISGSPVLTGQGLQVLGIIRDITERTRKEQALIYSARHDGLTGLYNRGVLEERLGAEVDRAGRYHHPITLFMLDIDHFKRINDTHGHQVGDAALCRVADVLKQTMRRSDIIARYGGEEFVIMLPETRREEGMELAERLCRAVAGEPYMSQGEAGYYLTVSIGVAVFPEDADAPAKLIEAADAAMYRAKESGRDRVVSA